jgi:adenylosuccinate synthase
LSCKAVIGLGFGDEGKGATVNSLCRPDPDKTLVIRYNGGHQAGHTVTDAAGDSHVFSNFGSGTLLGCPTYWSNYCTVDPVGFMREADILQQRFGIVPKIYMHRDCPVTTPFDILANTTNWEMIRNGTCGVGVGTTIQREEDHHSILVGDLRYPEVLELKLAELVGYYNVGVPTFTDFFSAIRRMMVNIRIVDNMPQTTDKGSLTEYIFEGAQGLLLDQNIGFFPHVTRSNTGSKNVLELLNGTKCHYYLVTRCYQTRHGNGPMTNEDEVLRIKANPKETNSYNVHQGHLRYSVLDLSLLRYGIERDKTLRDTNRKTLVVTCCDQMIDKYQFTVAGHLNECSMGQFETALKNYLGFNQIIFTYSPTGKRV